MSDEIAEIDERDISQRWREEVPAVPALRVYSPASRSIP